MMGRGERYRVTERAQEPARVPEAPLGARFGPKPPIELTGLSGIEREHGAIGEHVSGLDPGAGQEEGRHRGAGDVGGAPDEEVISVVKTHVEAGLLAHGDGVRV